MKNFKIDAETAGVEFENWAGAMDLDLDESAMDEDDKAGFLRQKKRIIKAIRRGALIFNENGEAVYTPQRPGSLHKEPITFRERTGASIMAMDGKKKGHDAAKMYAVLADMCKVHAKTFAGMVGEDVKVCEAIFALLMD